MVISHSGVVPPFLPRLNSCIHNWKLAERADMWGTSYAPKSHNWDLSTCCGTIDATRIAQLVRDRVRGYAKPFSYIAVLGLV